MDMLGKAEQLADFFTTLLAQARAWKTDSQVLAAQNARLEALGTRIDALIAEAQVLLNAASD